MGLISIFICDYLNIVLKFDKTYYLFCFKFNVCFVFVSVCYWLGFFNVFFAFFLCFIVSNENTQSSITTLSVYFIKQTQNNIHIVFFSPTHK